MKNAQLILTLLSSWSMALGDGAKMAEWFEGHTKIDDPVGDGTNLVRLTNEKPKVL